MSSPYLPVLLLLLCGVCWVSAFCDVTFPRFSLSRDNLLALGYQAHFVLSGTSRTSWTSTWCSAKDRQECIVGGRVSSSQQCARRVFGCGPLHCRIIQICGSRGDLGAQNNMADRGSWSTNFSHQQDQLKKYMILSIEHSLDKSIQDYMKGVVVRL